MREKIAIEGVFLTLAMPDNHESQWIDYNGYLQQLEAAWLRLSDNELPLNPRIVGEPGLGKTTLACALARLTGREIYIFQCTTDTRPEDLVVTGVPTGHEQIEYRGSGVVTAMIRGGVAVLDEANRMPERSWASLAPLMDDRRYIESELAALTIQAHPNFRLAVTMNSDCSVHSLPEYIQSRLKPKIEIVSPPWDLRAKIVRTKCSQVDHDLLLQALSVLKDRSERGFHDNTRDMLAFAQYAEKLRRSGADDPLKLAAKQVLEKGAAARL